MPGLGMTKLQAVNAVMLACGQGRASSLPATSDTSDAGEVHYFLDMSIEECICEGHPCSTQVLTVSASAGGEVDLSSLAPLALRVYGTGKHEAKLFTISGVKVYDTFMGTTACFGNAESVTLKIYKNLSASSPDNFEMLAPDLKQKVVHRATQFYRSRKRFDPNYDAMLTRDMDKSGQTVDTEFARPRGGTPYAPTHYAPLGSAPPVQVPRQGM